MVGLSEVVSKDVDMISINLYYLHLLLSFTIYKTISSIFKHYLNMPSMAMPSKQLDVIMPSKCCMDGYLMSFPRQVTGPGVDQVWVLTLTLWSWTWNCC